MFTSADKPHVPHIFPGEFLQYYPENIEKIPIARNPYMPQHAPLVAWHWPSDVEGINSCTCNTGAKTVVLSHLYTNAFFYQDWVGDKHRENSKKTTVFSGTGAGCIAFNGTSNVTRSRTVSYTHLTLPTILLV